MTRLTPMDPVSLKSSGTAQLATAGPVDSNLMRGAIVSHRNDSIPAMQHGPSIDDVRCPFCSSVGWPSVRFFAAYAANCGTAWGPDGYSSQSEPCRTIERLKLDIGIAALLAVAS